MTTGKAYGLFQSGAERDVVEEYLPLIRDVIGVPPSLELRLDEGIDTLRGNPSLFTFVSSLAIPFRYVLTATFPQETNREAAWHVKDIINQARLLDDLQFPQHEAPEEIVYESEGRYRLWRTDEVR